MPISAASSLLTRAWSSSGRAAPGKGFSKARSCFPTSSWMAGLKEGARFRSECVRLLIHLQSGQASLCSPLRLDTPSRASIYHPAGWPIGCQMADNVRELRPKAPESEKITINLGFVDLGHIDLMVQDGFYSNRTDFIRTAIRNQLDRHTDAVKQSVARKKLDLGLRHYTREELEAVEAAGETLDIQVLGLASIAPEVTPELARRTIAAIPVLGALHASPAVKAALSDRMK